MEILQWQGASSESNGILKTIFLLKIFSNPFSLLFCTNNSKIIVLKSLKMKNTPLVFSFMLLQIKVFKTEFYENLCDAIF